MKWGAVLSALLVASGVALAIDSVSLRLERISFQGWEFMDTELTLDWSGGTEPLISFQSRRVEHADSSTVITGLRATCLEGEVTGSSMRCVSGRLRFEHPALGAMASDLTFQARDQFRVAQIEIANLKIGPGSMKLAGEFNGDDWALVQEGENLDAELLRAILDPLDLRVNGLSISGRVGTRARVAGHQQRVRDIEWMISASELGFDTVEGEYAGAELQGAWDGVLKIEDDQGWKGHQRLTLEAGTLLTPYFLLEPGKQSISLAANLEADQTFSRIIFSPLTFDHAGLIKIFGEIQLDIDQSPNVEHLNLQSDEFSLGALYRAYIQPVLGDTLLRDLSLEGRAAVDRLHFSGGQISVDARLRDGFINLLDRAAVTRPDRLEFSSVDADLHWSNGEAAKESSVRIGRGSLFSGIDIGNTELNLTLGAQGMSLVSPVSVPVLDGTLEVETFAVVFEEQSPSIVFDGFLTPLSLAQFSNAVGLPPFPGKLSGMIPGFSYRDGSLRVDGVILIRVFDGSILVEDLILEGLLGAFPVMEADLKLQSLDLEQITDTFSFGKITGRLEGRVDDLRLEEWSPVRFDAWLGTPDSDQSPHWISQRAVENISDLGGAGMSGALSRGFLRVFKEFRYDRLGVSCRLDRGICDMGGIEPADQGYYLVKGGGIPRIDIKGFNRHTDWNRLTEKLREIGESGPPRVN